MKKNLIFLAIFLLYGCAEYTWVAPAGKSYYDTQVDYNDCLYYVNSNYPKIVPPPPKIIGYRCYGTTSGSIYSYGAFSDYDGSSITNCVPQYAPDMSGLAVGIRNLQRIKAFKECMKSKGYSYEKKQ
ncbi:MAG: hypothetical protein QXH07_07820 [Thermoplasmata archaeon]